jgi:xanthine dehydrogenase YagT iron-sulfur-binding subunit
MYAEVLVEKVNLKETNLKETNLNDNVAAIERPHVLDIGPETPPGNTTALTTPLTASRREFLIGAAAVGASLALAPTLLEGEAGAMPLTPAPAYAPAATPVNITLSINGADHALTVEPRVTLLDALRERIHLTGTKKGCDHGQCGACTVHVDGRRINSCLTLAIMHQGQKITTIEGLAEGDNLHPMQAAFIAHDGFQCGYCTPGQIMSAVAVVNEGHARTEADIKEQMSGNICRCGAYPNIVAAIQSVMDGKDGKQTAANESSNKGSGAFIVGAGNINASRSEGDR